jgi:hypothetical protein
MKGNFAMSHKKLLNWIVVAAVLLLASLVVLTLTRGTALKSVVYSVFLATVYMLLIASYLSRVAFVILGVFAVYKVLQERAKAGSASG